MGAITPVEAVKVRELDRGFKPFSPQGEAGLLGFPPNCMSCAEGGVCGEDVCQPFSPVSMWLFSQCSDV